MEAQERHKLKQQQKEMFNMKDDKIIISFTEETVDIEVQCTGKDLIIGTFVIIKELAKATGKEVPEVIDFLKLLSIEEEVEQNKEGEN